MFLLRQRRPPKRPRFKGEPSKFCRVGDTVQGEFAELLAESCHPLTVWLMGLDDGPSGVKGLLHGRNFLTVAFEWDWVPVITRLPSVESAIGRRRRPKPTPLG